MTNTTEEFLRDFLERQRELTNQARETTKILAKTNVESILKFGLESPLAIQKMEDTLEEMRAAKKARIEETRNAILGGLSDG